MIVLKPIIFYSDFSGCEATWVDRTQAPDIEIAEIPEVPAIIEVLEVLAVPEQQATYDEDGNELTPYVAPIEYVAPVAPVDAVPAVPARTEPGQITDTQVKCHSYHPTQMDMLRADALLFATPLDEYEDQITEMENEYIKPIPDPEEVLALERSNARVYLNNTDWYFARLAETGELVPEGVLTKRAEARKILQ